MTNKEEIIDAFNKEYKSIQEALRSAGYYAYNIKFRPHQEYRPEIYIEAREWCDGDKMDGS